jgi:hypothetical protein
LPSSRASLRDFLLWRFLNFASFSASTSLEVGGVGAGTGSGTGARFGFNGLGRAGLYRSVNFSADIGLPKLNGDGVEGADGAGEAGVGADETSDAEVDFRFLSFLFFFDDSLWAGDGVRAGSDEGVSEGDAAPTVGKENEVDDLDFLGWFCFCLEVCEGAGDGDGKPGDAACFDFLTLDSVALLLFPLCSLPKGVADSPLLGIP